MNKLGMNKYKILWILLLLLVFNVAAAGEEDEYFVKSVLIERISLFVNWPESTGITDTSRPFVIGIIGENPFGAVIDRVYSHRKIKGKKVEILDVRKLNQVPDCHVLFISASYQKLLPQILAVTKEYPVLTIGDTPGFAQQGVLVNFVVINGRLHFEINETALRAVPLTVRSRLLGIAKIVRSEGERP